MCNIWQQLMSAKKSSTDKGIIKIRGGKEIVEELTKKSSERYRAPNPINVQIKLNQFPWTDKQKEFFRIALHPSTRVVFVNGPAGTSKTLLSVYCALQMLNMKTINNILYLRSAVESSANSLGFLPGSAEEKLKFYNLPFLDKLDELLIRVKPEKLEEQGRISMFPVSFARGMNWEAKCVILDEAQNSTGKEIVTVLTRLGQGSKAFVLADPMQTDLKNPNLVGGCDSMIRAMFSDDEALEHGVYYFEFDEDDIMRSELVKFLVRKFRDME
jgi:phosphate starvation-inducible PhoH-like protein